ncbi:hypothetical protein EJB05_41288 [Eragrostis curvula]|uniref:Serine/threonine-protein phosphatase 2A 55 kDa regulatory subunit B n=1 Tax=Eragrostis curvula TaxID=38414 RepID=A0A5J9TBE2_9POAL|nr:hypothetical protein EJB05_41288 [Eragrostis curvula]
MDPQASDDAQAAAQPQQPLEWRFAQVFGERAAGEDVQEVDIISAIEFDRSGDHLATGDKGGRVVLFERTDARDFDYLKSLEIEEKINKIKWCQTANNALSLLSTNDKTIKYWKVQDKKVKRVSVMNLDTSQSVGSSTTANASTSSSQAPLPNGGCSEKLTCLSTDFSFPPGGYPSLRLPVVTSLETNPVARCRRVYAHAHDYHINSISNNSDGETFISADDLRINLWNLEINSQSFNIVDVKPSNMEDLTVNKNPANRFEEHEAPGARSFFTEIIASISDVKFSRDGRYILSRDYMTLKLWDLNMDSGPVSTFQVHEHLRSRLCDLYENDSIFDKFECCLSGDGLRVATGSYGNVFRVFGCTPGSTEATTLEASRNPMRRQITNPTRPTRTLTSFTRGVRRGGENSGVDANGNSFDFSTKLLHLAWHPTENSIACAAANSLYMYYA